MEKTYRRVNITILEEQYENLADRGLNVSGLIRDLLGDYLSESTIHLQVSDATRAVYDHVVANTGATDADLEVHLRSALASLLEEKIAAMNLLRKELLTDSNTEN